MNGSSIRLDPGPRGVPRIPSGFGSGRPRHHPNRATVDLPVTCRVRGPISGRRPQGAGHLSESSLGRIVVRPRRDPDTALGGPRGSSQASRQETEVPCFRWKVGRAAGTLIQRSSGQGGQREGTEPQSRNSIARDRKWCPAWSGSPGTIIRTVASPCAVRSVRANDPRLVNKAPKIRGPISSGRVTVPVGQ